MRSVWSQMTAFFRRVSLEVRLAPVNAAQEPLQFDGEVAASCHWLVRPNVTGCIGLRWAGAAVQGGAPSVAAAALSQGRTSHKARRRIQQCERCRRMWARLRSLSTASLTAVQRPTPRRWRRRHSSVASQDRSGQPAGCTAVRKDQIARLHSCAQSRSGIAPKPDRRPYTTHRRRAHVARGPAGMGTDEMRVVAGQPRNRGQGFIKQAGRGVGPGAAKRSNSVERAASSATPAD
jgi:hypothetical protein